MKNFILALFIIMFIRFFPLYAQCEKLKEKIYQQRDEAIASKIEQIYIFFQNLNHPNKKIRHEAAISLSHLDYSGIDLDEIVSCLIQRLSDPDETICYCAILTLSSIGFKHPKALASLIIGLDSPNEKLQSKITKVLIDMILKTKKKIDVLNTSRKVYGGIILKKDYSLYEFEGSKFSKIEITSEKMIEVLHHIAGKEAIPILIELLKDVDSKRQEKIYKVLIEINNENKESILEILKCLESKESNIRLSSLLVLDHISQPVDELILSLIKRLKDENKEVRLLTIKLLGKVTKKKADVIQEMSYLLQDTDEEIKKEIIKALEKLKK